MAQNDEKDMKKRDASKKPALKKAKTDMDVAEEPEEKPAEKPKAEESDDASDSAPSDDNLDEDAILKLIPKKYGKRKFLKGVEDVVEKKVKKKKKPAQPKTELMPCMQSKAKENLAKRKAEEEADKPKVKASAKKTISISNPVLKTKRNGLYVRDVATQIKYTGDASRLSLMEQDILNHTGCKWSKIIYPGYKGKADFRSVERTPMSKLSEGLNPVSPMANLADINCFNSDLRVTDQLRSHTKKTEILAEPTAPKAFSAKKESHPVNRLQDLLSHEPTNPFNSITEKDKKVSALQQRIMDGNFSEPRSLIGGFVPTSGKKPTIRRNAFEYGKMDQAVKATTKFEMGLEVVPEKVNERTTVDLLTMSLGSFDKKIKDHRNAKLTETKVKKMVNGSLVS